MSFEITVYGKPQPAGSKRAFVMNGRAVVTDANAKSRPWKQEIAETAIAYLSDDPTDTGIMEGPVLLVVDFYLARPKGHYGSGKNAGIVKDSAPYWPTTKPDTTKLLRAAEDALTGIVWRDDSQVVAQVAYKRYADEGAERCEIRVTPLEAPTPLASTPREVVC